MITDRLLDAAGISVDRLPMLPVVFDRMARVMADAMRQKSASPSYVSVSCIENDRIGDILDEFEANALVAVLYSPEWDSRVLVGFDRDFIFTMSCSGPTAPTRRSTRNAPFPTSRRGSHGPFSRSRPRRWRNPSSRSPKRP